MWHPRRVRKHRMSTDTRAQGGLVLGLEAAVGKGQEERKGGGHKYRGERTLSGHRDQE